MLICGFYYKDWIREKSLIQNTILIRKYTFWHFESFYNGVKDVSFIETVWKIESPSNHFFKRLIGKSWNYFVRIKVLHSLSFLFLLHLLVYLSLLLYFLNFNFLENSLDFFSKLGLVLLDVLYKTFDINNRKAIIFL